MVAVVCDRELPLAAVAEPPVGGDTGPLTFLDVPAPARALAAVPGLRVLAAAELAAPFRQADWPHVLAGGLAYWRPATVGEALFTYWD